MRTIELNTLKRVDTIITVSGCSRTDLLTMIGKEHGNTVTIHNGIDPNRFVFREAPGQDHGNQLLFLGGLKRVKGIDILLQALQTVIRELPETKLHIAGSGPEFGRLESLARNLALSESVVFLGKKDNIHGLFLDSSCLILPSRQENLPLVLLEAMSSGVPVIATEVGGIPEIVRHGETGILVPPENPGRLAEAIIDTLRNPERAAERAKRARAAIQEDYSVRGMVDRYLDMISELVRHHDE